MGARRLRLARLTATFGALLLGALLRLQSASVAQGVEEFWRSDWEYYGAGVQLADDGRFSPYPTFPATALRMPLYPAFLGTLRRLSPGMASVRRVQALLDVAQLLGACLLAGLLGGPWCAMGAALLGAFAADTPILQLSSPQLETFYGLLVLAGVCALVHWSLKPGSTRRAAAAGAALGVSLLCRSTLLLLPVLAAAGLGLAERRKARPLALAVFLCGSYLFLAPWALRNWTLFGRPVPVEDGALALNLWGASVGMVRSPSMTELAAAGKRAPLLVELQSLPNGARGDRLVALALRNLRKDPRPFLRALPQRLLLLWEEQLWLWALAAGLLLLRRWDAPHGLALGVAVYFNVNLVMGVLPRYVRPAHYLLCVLAARGALAAFELWVRPLGEGPVRPGPGLRRFSLGTLGFALALALAAFLPLAREAAAGREEVPPKYRLEPRRYARLKALQAEGIEHVLHGRLEKASGRFAAALKDDPCFGEALLSRALVWDWTGRRDRASADYRQALACLEGVGPQDRRLAEF